MLAASSGVTTDIMIPLRVIVLPVLLKDEDLVDRAVVVFDVLRATTSIASMIASGAKDVRVFGNIDAARSAAAEFGRKKVLAGEVKTLPPPGFDLGNSPGGFTRDTCDGATVFFSTTNGTAALVAGHMAGELFTCSVVNRTATAKTLVETNKPITLLCSGSEGQVSQEDVIGCGALIEALGDAVELENDAARIALAAWRGACGDLAATFRDTYGGRNIRRNQLDADIDFCAVTDRFDVTVRVKKIGGHLVATRG